jgi:hypothetical protein
MAETTVFIQCEPEWSSYARDSNGNPDVAGMRVTKMTKNRPDRITGVLVKVKLRIPDGAFKPLSPTVIIDVPESALDYEPTVTVEHPEGSGAAT